MDSFKYFIANDSIADDLWWAMIIAIRGGDKVCIYKTGPAGWLCLHTDRSMGLTASSDAIRFIAIDSVGGGDGRVQRERTKHALMAIPTSQHVTWRSIIKPESQQTYNSLSSFTA
jgi:hypothetical protein